MAPPDPYGPKSFLIGTPDHKAKVYLEDLKRRTTPSPSPRSSTPPIPYGSTPTWKSASSASHSSSDPIAPSIKKPWTKERFEEALADLLALCLTASLGYGIYQRTHVPWIWLLLGGFVATLAVSVVLKGPLRPLMVALRGILTILFYAALLGGAAFVIYKFIHS